MPCLKVGKEFFCWSVSPGGKIVQTALDAGDGGR